MAPMTTQYADGFGGITDKLVRYYEARAKGGTGMVTVEGAYINADALQAPTSIDISDDKCIAALSRVATVIKDNGATAVLQLIHSGVEAWIEQSKGPSAIGKIDGKPISTSLTPKEMTPDEVILTVRDFAKAAKRAQRAGFDAVEVHGSHGYLIMQFLSPLTNVRNDSYGLDRNLFAVEIIQEIKKVCGKDYPVIFRLCGDENLGDTLYPRGITIEDAKETARRLEAAGVDSFEVTGGSDDVMHLYVPSAYVLEDKVATFLEYAEEIKKVVSVPISTGCAVETPEQAEEILASGKVDMLFLGRPLITDPEWVRKVETGREKEIRPCVKCIDCIDFGCQGKQIRCALNPYSGNEDQYMDEAAIPVSRTSKKVLVIGGGPAGMEAAKTSALRGHQVILAEKEDRLGGTVNVLVKPHFKYRYVRLIDYYCNEMKRLNVDVRLNTLADEALINEIRPDAVIWAAGSKEARCPIPGNENCVYSEDILNGTVKAGEKVIVIGCGMVGAETAYELAKQGKQVEVFEAMEPTSHVSSIALFRKTGLFDQYHVKLHVHTPIIEIHPGEVMTVDEMGRKIYTKADTIISAIGRVSADNALVHTLKEKQILVLPIGDAVKPRKVAEAIHEAFHAALSI